jgi:hypothetical protein
MKTKTRDEKREMSNQTQKLLVGFLPFLCLGFFFKIVPCAQIQQVPNCISFRARELLTP